MGRCLLISGKYKLTKLTNTFGWVKKPTHENNKMANLVAADKEKPCGPEKDAGLTLIDTYLVE